MYLTKRQEIIIIWVTRGPLPPGISFLISRMRTLIAWLLDQWNKDESSIFEMPGGTGKINALIHWELRLGDEFKPK